MDLPAEENLLAQPTRARLFGALQRLRRAATTEELAGELGLHVNGVRRQLERMQEGGLLERTRATQRRGRPRDQWSIAPGATPTGTSPEAYMDLARWLTRAIPVGPAGLRRVREAGREIGRELAPDSAAEHADESFGHILTVLGFQPQIEIGREGQLCCTLGNCPYRNSALESPEIVCTLHEGMTQGLLEELEPGGRLTRFEPHDPKRAGCAFEISRPKRPETATALD